MFTLRRFFLPTFISAKTSSMKLYSMKSRLTSSCLSSMILPMVESSSFRRSSLYNFLRILIKQEGIALPFLGVYHLIVAEVQVLIDHNVSEIIIDFGVTLKSLWTWVFFNFLKSLIKSPNIYRLLINVSGK